MKKLIIDQKTLNAVKVLRKGDPTPDPLDGVGVMVSNCLPKVWSGKYIMPDGSVVAPDNVRIDDKFCSYGPEDIWYLLWAGTIQKHMETLAYLMEHSFMRMMDMSYSPGFMMPVYDEPARFNSQVPIITALDVMKLKRKQE